MQLPQANHAQGKYVIIVLISGNNIEGVFVVFIWFVGHICAVQKQCFLMLRRGLYTWWGHSPTSASSPLMMRGTNSRLVTWYANEEAASSKVHNARNMVAGMKIQTYYLNWVQCIAKISDSNVDRIVDRLLKILTSSYRSVLVYKFQLPTGDGVLVYCESLIYTIHSEKSASGLVGILFWIPEVVC